MSAVEDTDQDHNYIAFTKHQAISWRFPYASNLNNTLVSEMMDKIRDSVYNRFKINYSYIYLLRNIETIKTLVWTRQKRQKSPWFATHGDAQAWLERQEEGRLGTENINLPSTKFV